MKVLVTGVNGQLGHDVMKWLEINHHEGIGADVSDMDLTSEQAVSDFVLAQKPDAIIHCAAYTAVDRAEEEVGMCRAVNVLGTQYLAQCAAKLDIKMVYISTDYVFSGEGDQPFLEDDLKAPQNVYGQSKLDGELKVQELLKKYFIVRISWAFGVNGQNFVKTMLKLGKERSTLSVVDDQVGSPTYTDDAAKLLVSMIETEKYGVYHATNQGYCSWYEFAIEIFKQAKIDVEVVPVNSETFFTKASRPKNSRLSPQHLIRQGFDVLPTWQDALSRYMIELDKEEAL
jgi:dTDP-4-dehydrorhamnose reductase